MNHLHRQLVTEHRTVVLVDNPNGRITVRRDRGAFHLKMWDKQYKKRTTTLRKTLKGAIETAEFAKESYL